MIAAALFLWLSAGFAGVVGTILHKDGHLTIRDLLQAVSLAPLGLGAFCFFLAHVVERYQAPGLDEVVVDVRRGKR